LTLDFLDLSDGRPCNQSENRVNNINMLEVYHEIRGGLEILIRLNYLRDTVGLFFGLEQHINQRVAQHLHIVRIAVGSGLADVGHCLTQLRSQGNIEIGII